MDVIQSIGTSITNAQLKDWLIFIAGVTGLSWYYLCLWDMGRHPTPTGTQAGGFRQFQSLSVTTISVSLATYVGFVVGLTPPDSAAAGGAAVVSSSASYLQVASALLYVASLALAVYFYSQSKDQTEPALAGLAKSLLGFVAGVFSISLNVPG